MNTAPALRLVETDLFERQVRLRLPFRFGAATLREARQAFVRVRIEDAGGRTAIGMAAELMVPKWFDKSPDLSNLDNDDQLRRSLGLAAEALALAGSGSAFGLHTRVEAAHHARAVAQGLNGLIASFGLALLDRAILDGLCRLHGVTVTTAVQSNLAGIDLSTTPDLDGLDLPAFLQTLKPARSIAARHTVGLVDAITIGEIAPADRLNDGLPESLEEAIDTYGHRHFKIKVSGDIDADLDRLCRIAALLDARVPDYALTLDGNEQFASAEAVEGLLARISEEPCLKRFASAILFIEQPIARAHAFERPVTSLGRFKPIEIDESDADIEAFATARRLGYTGISSKSCKGFYRSLLNRARMAKWHAEDGRAYFMSAEDLTTQGGLGVQQDLVLAALIGMHHVERNGHHYVDGMAGAPLSEQTGFIQAHADLYSSVDGRARLKIENGQIAIGSVIDAVGLGSSAVPDWDAMETMPSGRTEWHSKISRSI